MTLSLLIPFLYALGFTSTSIVEVSTIRNRVINIENTLIPTNDNACNATLLVSGRNAGTTVGATVSNMRDTKTICGNTPGKDVWFKSRFPSSGAFKIRPESSASSTIQSVSLAVYTGTCGNLQYANVCSNGQEFGVRGTPDQEVFIRAWTGSAPVGTSFSLQLFNVNIADTLSGPIIFSPVVPIFSTPSNDEPCNATALSPTATCSPVSSTTIAATQTNSPSPISICGTIPLGDVWFKTQIPSSRVLSLTTVPTTSAMTVATMAIYTGACSSLVFSGICTQNVNLSVSGQPNTTVFIRVWGNSQSGGPFTICAKNSGIQGVAPLPLPAVIKKPTNDEPCKAIQLTVRGECSNAQGTTIEASQTLNPGAVDACGPEPTRDVWFKAIVPLSGIMTIKTLTTTSVMIGATVAIYTGTCSNLSFTGTCSSDQNLVINGIPGTIIFIRVWGSSETGGPFTICVKNKGTPGAIECHLN